MPPLADLPAVPAQLALRARSQAGVVTTAEVYASGVTKGQLAALVRHRRWARAGRGAYVIEGWVGAGGVTEMQRAWAAWLVGGACDVVAGRTAWRLHGLDGAEPSNRIEMMIVGSSKRAQPQERTLRWRRTSQQDVVRIAGLPVMSVVAALIDASTHVSREAFVSMLDSALHHRRLSVGDADRLRVEVASRARAWIDLADGRSESPLETRLRLIAHDAGIAPSDLQHEVVRGGRVVARIDLVWLRLGLKLAVEADGKGPHSLPDALFRDRRRQADLSALGWVVLRFTWDDVVHRSAEVADQIRRHLLLAA